MRIASGSSLSPIVAIFASAFLPITQLDWLVGVEVSSSSTLIQSSPFMTFVT
jgi:hypothetical protein